MKNYKQALIESMVTPKTDNAEMYQDETEPKRYKGPSDDITGIKSVDAKKYENSQKDVFETHKPHDRISELLKEQYKDDDDGTITTLDDIERKLVSEGRLSEEKDEDNIEKPEEPKDENKGKAKKDPEETETKKSKDDNMEEQKEESEKENKEMGKKKNGKKDSDGDYDGSEEDSLNEELETLLSLYEQESKIDTNQKHLEDIPESDDGSDLEDILGDDGEYMEHSVPKEEKPKIPNTDSDNPTSSETSGYTDISENEIDSAIDELFNESDEMTFEDDTIEDSEELLDENISLFDDSEDIEEGEITNESEDIEQDDSDALNESFSDIEKNMLLDALNEDKNVEELLDEVLNDK